MKKSNTAERLQEVMDLKGLKQIDVLQRAAPFCQAYGVKLGKSALNQYLSGKFEPRQDKLTILGLALDVSEAWLMGFDVPMERQTAPTTPEDDERREEYVKLFSQLNTEQQNAVIYIIKGFLGKQ